MIIKQDSNEDYHKNPSISASGLKTIYSYSVQHFLKQKPFSSNAMNLGQAIHTIMIEGQKIYGEQYFEIPDIGDKRKKENKQLLDNLVKRSEGKKIINSSDSYIIKNVMDSFLNNELAQFYCKGKCELSHYLEFMGIPIRVRPDVIGKDWISDVKTCQFNSPKKFKRQCYDLCYHLQATFYCDALGYDPKKFKFIAVETKHPFSIAVYNLSDQMIEHGRDAYKKAISDWKFYLETKIPLGYTNQNMMDDGSITL